MDLAKVNKAIDEILGTRKVSPSGTEYYDDPEAHDLEDRLYHAFVRHVAETAGGELRVMALKVLETEALKFSRWYE